MAREIVGVEFHAAGPAENRLDVRQQRFADLPGRRVPQVGRAVVHGVVAARRLAISMIGWVNEVGCAQLKPMPTSQETSTIRLPGVKDGRSSSVTKISGASGSCSTQLTTMSLSASKRATGIAAVRRIRPRPVGRVRVAPHLDDLRGVDRRTDGGDLTIGQDTHIVNAVGVQRGDRAAGGGAEPDDRSAQPPAVAAGDPGQLHGVQDRAVAGELVVLVKDVQPESAVGLPVVHRLEGDQRQAPIDGDLRQRGILHAVRPPPNNLSRIEFGEILGLDLGQQNDVASGDELLPGADSADESGQCVIRGAKLRAVAVFEEDPTPDPMVDPGEMRRVNWQSTLVRFARTSQNP